MLHSSRESFSRDLFLYVPGKSTAAPGAVESRGARGFTCLRGCAISPCVYICQRQQPEPAGASQPLREGSNSSASSQQSGGAGNRRELAPGTGAGAGRLRERGLRSRPAGGDYAGDFPSPLPSYQSTAAAATGGGSRGTGRSPAARPAVSSGGKGGSVYYCASGNTVRYYRSAGCRGLSRCGAAIDPIPLSEAWQYMDPFMICFEEN